LPVRERHSFVRVFKINTHSYPVKIRTNAQNPLWQTYFPYREVRTPALACISKTTEKINGIEGLYLNGSMKYRTGSTEKTVASELVIKVRGDITDDKDASRN